MINLLKRKFGRLRVVSYSHQKGFDHYWNCLCDCGISKPVCHRGLLYSGQTSCGCLQREKASKFAKTKRFKITKNQIFGRLTVLKELEPYESGHRKFLFKCSCGNRIERNLQSVRIGREPSCGCRMKELISSLKTTHGKTGSTEYNTYHSMIKRCFDKTSSDYPRYGGRGISIHPSWLESFENFYQDLVSTIGLRPSKEYSLDRINNDGNYEKNNIKWSTKQEQANNRRSNKLVTAFGKTQSLMQWDRETGINWNLINRRIFQWNWKIEDALTLPPDNHRRYSQTKKAQNPFPDLSRSVIQQ